MAEVKFLKGSEEWMLFMDYWRLCQKYWEPEDNDDYWYSLIDAVKGFHKKYGTDFSLALSKCLVNEASRKLNLKDGGQWENSM